MEQPGGSTWEREEGRLWADKWKERLTNVSLTSGTRCRDWGAGRAVIVERGWWASERDRPMAQWAAVASARSSSSSSSRDLQATGQVIIQPNPYEIAPCGEACAELTGMSGGQPGRLLPQTQRGPWHRLHTKLSCNVCTRAKRGEKVPGETGREPTGSIPSLLPGSWSRLATPRRWGILTTSQVV